MFLCILQDPPLFAVAEMIVHRKVSDEYETEEQFEKALLDKLTDYPIAIGVPSYPSLFQPPEQTTVSPFFFFFVKNNFISLKNLVQWLVVKPGYYILLRSDLALFAN